MRIKEGIMLEEGRATLAAVRAPVWAKRRLVLVDMFSVAVSLRKGAQSLDILQLC